MEPGVTTSRVEIDLTAIEHNTRVIRSILQPSPAPPTASPPPPASPGQPTPAAVKGGPGGAQLCAIIKQDAYGLGAARIARKLAALGVDLLAVFCTAEARALADAPIRTPMLVLMPVTEFDRKDPLYRLAVGGRLHLTLHSEAQALELASVASRVGVTFPVHVQVDTGMSRGGCLPDAAEALIDLALSSPRFRLAGIMTHFSSPASDDEFTREQARLFRGFIERIKPRLAAAADRLRGSPPVVIHAANSAAAFRSESLHASMVRIGQALYGYVADAFTDRQHVQFAEAAASLRPALRWVSRIVHVEDVPAGWPVGYNRLFHTRKPSRIALVPVGYADGYPLALTNKGQVRLTGLAWDRPRTAEPTAPGRGGPPGESGAASAFAPVVGRVSMDQITIDVTDLPEEFCRPGREVEIYGTDPGAPNHVPTLAAAAGTITHQLLCAISPALERVYLTRACAEGDGEGEATAVGGRRRAPAGAGLAGPAARG
jgi:alanine racemase